MQVTSNSQLQIPESLREKLLSFRSRVWRLKMFEAFAAAMIGAALYFLEAGGTTSLIEQDHGFKSYHKKCTYQ